MTNRLKTLHIGARNVGAGRRLLPILALALAWMAFSYQPASAQSAQPDTVVAETALEEYGIACEAGDCTIDVSLERVNPLAVLGASFAIDVMEDNLTFLPEGAGIEIDDNLTLKLPVGDLQLVDADVVLAMDSEGNVVRMRGSAEVPFPGFVSLDMPETDAPLRADLGLDYGKNMMDLNAPLDDERQYLFLDFHTGLSAPAVTEGGDGVVVAIPRGQDATLIIDTKEPYAYLAGNVSYSVEDQLEFVGQMLNVEGLEAIDGLPIRQRVGLQMATSVGKGAEPFFQAGGAYSVDAGLVGRLVGVELAPLATQGQVTVERDGVLLDGVATSRIAPNMLFNGSTEAVIFVPFDTNLRAAYAQIDADAEIPFAGASVDAMARIDGYDGVVAQASITTPLSGTDEVVALNVEDDGRRFSLVGSMADGAGDTMTRSYLFVKNQAGSGVEAIADSADAGRYWSQQAWCAVSGCERSEAIAVAE